MSLKSIDKFLFLVILFFSVQSLSAQDEIVLDKIIAKVGGNIILKSTLEKTYLDYVSQGQVTSNLKCQVLNGMVTSKLMVEKAKIDSVIISEDEVNAALDQRISYILQQVGSKEEVEQRFGKTLESIKAELYDQIEEQLVVQRMEGLIVSDIKVTPSEIKKFYKKIPVDSLPFYSAEVSLAQIVMVPEANKYEKQRVKDQLLEFRAKILSGEEDFGDLARRFSEDPGSAIKGGDLGLTKRGQFVPEFEATAFSLKKGEISAPVESDFGYHMIQLVERLGNTFRSKHILIAPKPTENDFNKTEQKLDSIADAIRSDSITFEAAAKEYSKDRATSSSGGFFLDNTGAQRLSVEQLSPELFFTIDTMTVGTISKPMRFTTDDGKKAVRILYYKNRISPHQANLKQDYHKLQQAVKQSKKNNELNRWFKEVRNEIYLEIDPEYESCNLLK